MRVAIGADHAGYELKVHLVKELERRGHDVEDFGTHSTESVDYPPICAAVARLLIQACTWPHVGEPSCDAWFAMSWSCWIWLAIWVASFVSC